MKEKFSNGRNGEVFFISEQERILYPHADFSKEQKYNELFLFKLIFYQHKIARLLFPANFIEVIGTSEPDGETTYVFSKEAKVNPQHATFSSHKNEHFLCGECESHKEFHSRILNDAQNLGHSLHKKGINVPYLDETDYCISNGNIVFFEIESIDTTRLRRHLSKQGTLRPEIQQARNLLERYQNLRTQYWSKKAA